MLVYQSEEAPAAVWHLPELQELDLSMCNSLTSLWPTADDSSSSSSLLLLSSSSSSSSLTKLKLRGCTSLATLPEDLGKLSSLQVLDLSICISLTKLPAVSNMGDLSELQFSSCHSLAQLPSSFGSLSRLSTLELQECDALRSIPNLRGMSRLTRMLIQHCNRLEAVPEGLEQLKGLKSMHVSSCSKVAAWPELDSAAKSSWGMGLQELRLTNCPRLARLPDSFGQAVALTHVTLQGCHALEDLPRSIGRVSMLTRLEVLECSKLKSMPDTIWNLSKLKVLRLEQCSSLASLPDVMLPRQAVPSLQRLVLTGCGLSHLPDFVGRLTSLTKLDLSRCSKLESLPWQMEGASKLHTVSVAFCSKLSKLPEKLPASLRKLDLSYCRELSSLGESLLYVVHQIGNAEVVLAGWEYLLAEQLELQDTSQLVLKPSNPKSYEAITTALRRATVIEKLLSDESFVRDLLTKLSWLATLLASAAFAAGRAPPGGWMQGGLPSCSSTTMGQSTCPAGAQTYMRQFFVLDLLTFGFASALVMFLVACAIPRRDIGARAAVAGQMYLSLCLSVIMLSATLGSGMWALWAGVLAVYPTQHSWDIWGPFVGSLVMMTAAFGVLMIRPLLLYPGWPALHKAVTMDPLWVGAVKFVLLVVGWLVNFIPPPVRQRLQHTWQGLQQQLQQLWQWLKQRLQRRWHWIKQRLQQLCVAATDAAPTETGEV